MTCGKIKPVSEMLAGASYALGYKPDCRDCANKAFALRYAADPALRERCKQAQDRQPRERKRAYARSWKRANRELVNAGTNARRRRLRQQQPPWADRKELRAIYCLCPPGYEVDHAIPLRGEAVSGLHVPWNLQYLPKAENQQKGNRLLEAA